MSLHRQETSMMQYTVSDQQQLHCCLGVLTRMGRWKLWFALLLLLMFCTDSQANGELLVKTIGKEPDATPICTNDTQTIIVLLVCKIRTERSRGEECRLVYQYPLGFEHGCDSRFTLLTKNQTVFLHLTDLTAEDSGNYTCECSRPDGTDIIHLNITVEGLGDEANSTKAPFSSVSVFQGTAVIVPVITGVTVFIIITGVILGFIYRKLSHRRQQLPVTSHPNTEAEGIEPYSVFMQKENELYSTARIHSLKRHNSDVFERHGRDGTPL